MVERRKIIFSGQVQGVGFRMTAAEIGENFQVGGTVRNLSDGRVELIVQGDSGEIDKFVERLREHFGSFLRNVDQNSLPAIDQVHSGIRIVH